MAEVLAEFPYRIQGGGVTFRARVCAAPMSDGRWRGWIEFIPFRKGQRLLRSPRETTQPNRTDAKYWATGLTPVYLEGALERARRRRIRKRASSAKPIFNAPAPDFVEDEFATSGPVLDPFSVYARGEKQLRQRLGALSTWHLVNIIRAYDLSDEPGGVLARLPVPELISTIVAACRRLAAAAR
jgi:hypothetical protein